ncbi:MAG: hypothetical protein V1816_05580 [Pseudomonadota bacterium]
MIDFVDVRDLDEKDVELLKALAESLRERALMKKAVKAREPKDGFTRSAGAWKGLVDAEELIADIYSSRLVSNRPGMEL